MLRRPVESRVAQLRTGGSVSVLPELVWWNEAGGEAGEGMRRVGQKMVNPN